MSDDGEYNGRKSRHPKALSLQHLASKGRKFDDSQMKEKKFIDRARRLRDYQRLLKKEGRITGTNVRVAAEDVVGPIKKKKYKGKRDFAKEEEEKRERERSIGKVPTQTYQRFQQMGDTTSSYMPTSRESDSDDEDGYAAKHRKSHGQTMMASSSTLHNTVEYAGKKRKREETSDDEESDNGGQGEEDEALKRARRRAGPPPSAMDDEEEEGEGDEDESEKKRPYGKEGNMRMAQGSRDEERKDDRRAKKKRKLNLWDLYEQKKKEREEERARIEQEKAEKARFNKKREMERKQQYKRLTKKTPKGQPVMKHVVMDVLKKLRMQKKQDG